MQKENKNIPEKDDGKIEVKKSVFQSARELREQQEEEMRKQAELRQRQKQEEYDRKIQEERIELMRLKQGVIEESDTIYEEQPEEIKLSLWKKITNFFYHNKWWLFLVIFFVALASYLTYTLLMRPNPDMIVLILCDNETIGTSAQFEDYIETFIEDYNGNGEIKVSAYYIPYSDNSYVNYQTGNETKLTTEMQSADAVIVVGGSNINPVLDPNNTLVDLSEIYPDNIQVRDYGFFLKNTKFAERIGVDPSEITGDLYIGIRKPRNLLYDDEEDMQKTYDRDFPVLDKIIKDLSE
ncbi:MAG: hypothetical protein NC177_03265 [Ruminococcus flavefaciens]|nr:hypothetical protein [Ruminococcus flavefaciens]